MGVIGGVFRGGELGSEEFEPVGSSQHKYSINGGCSPVLAKDVD